jgi:transcription elongation GreA/GreB family factor
MFLDVDIVSQAHLHKNLLNLGEFNMSIIKKEIIQAFVNKLTLERNELIMALEETRGSTQSETKSSAGDKYETQREMMQMEINRMESQISNLNDSISQWNSFNTIDNTVNWGSLIEISIGGKVVHLIIGPSSGDIQLNKNTIKSISKDSPIGKAIWGQTAPAEFEFSGKTIKLMSCS